MAYIGKSPGTGVRNRFIYTATAAQTTFSGSDDHSRTLSYTDAEFMDVFLNGVKLDKSDYTATSGTSIVLGSGATAGDNLEVLAFDTFSVFSGEFSQDVTIGADLTVDTDTLVVDSTNNQVGIGTSSPSEKLQVQGSGTTRITVGNSTVNTTGQTTGIDFEPISNLTNSAKINVVNGLSPTTASAYTAGFQFVTEDYNGSSFSQKTAVTIGASGNVGIGTSDIKGTVHAKNTSDNATLSSVEESIVLSHQSGSYTSGNYYNVLGFAKANSNGGTLGASIAPTMDGSGQTTALTFGVASGGGSVAERMRILSGGGITFNGDTATANALDDYEEGTFTPTVTSGTISQASGTYRKIGSLCTVTGLIGTFSDRTSTAPIGLTGLPFNIGKTDVAYPSGNMTVGFNERPDTAYALNSTTIRFYNSQSTGSSYVFVAYNDLNLSGSAMYFSFTYITA